MSHFSVIKTQIKNKEALCKALEKMGIAKNKIELFDNTGVLKGYNQTVQAKNAAIRVTGVSNYGSDLGFILQSDGTYSLSTDTHGSKFNQEWQTQLTQKYSAEVVKEIASHNNFYIESEEEINGDIVMRVVSAF